MKSLIIICAIVTIVNSRPQFGFLAEPARILRNEFSNFVDGFSFNVDTSDYFHHDARGHLESDTGNDDDEGLEVRGSYSYVDTNGYLHTVEYTAGKDGFRPVGPLLVPSAGVKRLGTAPCVATICGAGLG